MIGVLAAHPDRVVYLCDDRDLERHVVVEVLELAGERATRFVNAARAVARCKHPDLATVYDLVTDGGRPCLVREHVNGTPLLAWPGRVSASTPRRAELLARVARALAHAHRHGLSHGALTADAVQISRHGTPRLVGVGMAGALAAAADAPFDTAAAQRADVLALTALVSAFLGDGAAWPPQTSADELATTLARLGRHQGAAAAPAPPRAVAAGTRGRAGRIAATLAGVVALIAIVAIVARPWGAPAPPRGSSAIDGDGPARVEAVRLELGRLDALGQHDAAERVLDDFLTEEDDAHTAAAGWLLRGDRLRAQVGPHARRAAAAYATGFALAPDADVQRRALASLAAVHHSRWEWDAFAAAIDAYAVAPGAPTVEGDALTEARHVLFRDHGRALASPAPSTVALAGHLFEGRRIDLASPRTIDLDGDGRHEILGTADGTLRAVRASDLHELARAPLGPDDDVACAGRDDFGVFLLIITRPPGGGQRASLRSFPAGPTVALGTEIHRGCNVVDLDGDGADELYLVTGDQAILQFRRVRADRVTTRRWHVGSTVSTLLAGDLDEDGRPELIFSAAEWRAYDVRLARLDAAGELVVVDRVRLGVVVGLGALGRGADGLPRVAAFNVEVYPTAVRMPPGAPSGLPPGMSTLVVDGDRLRLERHTPIALPPESYPAGAMVTADLDGDGLQDLAHTVSGDGTTLLLLGRRHDGYEARPIREFVLLAELADGQPGLALLARIGPGRDAWLLRQGDPPIPAAAPAPARPPRAAPLATLGDPTLRAAWERAERLAYIGQEAAAAAALQRVAAQASRPALRGRALARAAELLRRGGHRAGDALEALADRPERPPAQSVAAAADAIADDLGHVALGDALARAARLERLRNLPAAALRARLAALPLPAADSVAAFDGAALHPAWRIEHALALDVVPGRGRLTLETLRAGTVATLALDARGAGMYVTIEGELTRMEWASELRVELGVRGAPGPRIAVGVVGRGGGRRYQRDGFCVDRMLPAISRPLADADEVVPFHLELAIAPAAGRARCAITLGDHRDAREVEFAPTDATAWELRLGAGIADMNLMRAQLAHIQVRGAAVATVPAPEAAIHDVIHHRYRGADARLAGVGGWPALLLRMVLAHRQGAPATADALLADALAGPAADRPSLAQLAELVRLRDGLLLPSVIAALRADALPVIERALASAAFHELDEPRVRAEILRAVAALPERALARADAGPVAAMYGEALLDGGRLQEGRRVLRRSLNAAPIGAATSRAAYLLARDAAATGDPAEARRWALRSLALAPEPELAADLILLDHGLAALARTPGWEPVLAVGRTLAVAPEP